MKSLRLEVKRMKTEVFPTSQNAHPLTHHTDLEREKNEEWKINPERAHI